MDRNLRRIMSWWLIVFYSLLQKVGWTTVGVHEQAAHKLWSEHMGESSLSCRRSAGAQCSTSTSRGKVPPDSSEVLVQADMFDKSLKVDGAHLQLGPNSPSEGAGCGPVQSSDEEFTILARLTDCGTKLSSTEEKIIYSNVLLLPKPYDLLDAISLYPIWIPFTSIDSVDGQIYFSLQIMSDDWQYERGSTTFFVGDLIRFEVSIIMGHHIPLRVYVDHCVATTTPDAEAAVRYDFNEHYGYKLVFVSMKVDAFLTNSNSYFLPGTHFTELYYTNSLANFHKEVSNEAFAKVANF
uniref:Zona pellucida sperm-binding protein 3 n=1 Tax=Xiphophorus couchianus TaxID=32473 RepID=A0A3B5KX44_9TELE